MHTEMGMYIAGTNACHTVTGLSLCSGHRGAARSCVVQLGYSTSTGKCTTGREGLISVRGADEEHLQSLRVHVYMRACMHVCVRFSGKETAHAQCSVCRCICIWLTLKPKRRKHASRFCLSLLLRSEYKSLTPFWPCFCSLASALALMSSEPICKLRLGASSCTRRRHSMCSQSCVARTKQNGAGTFCSTCPSPQI